MSRQFQARGLRPALILTLGLSAAVLTSGCAHSLLYDENRDKQAQDAQKAVTEAHVADAVASLEKTFTAVAAREETSAREQEVYLFDLELATLVRARSLRGRFDEKEESGVDGLITVGKARLVELGMVLADGEKELSDARVTELNTTLRTNDAIVRNTQRSLAAAISDFQGTTGHEFGNCVEIYGAAAVGDETIPSARFLATLVSDDARGVARITFEALTSSCRKIDGTRKAQRDLFAKGLVRSLQQDVQAVERRISDYESKRTAAQVALDKAIKEFQPVKNSTETEGSKLESLQERADTLQAKLTGIVELFGAAGLQIIATEKLTRLESLLGAIAEQPGDTPVNVKPDDQVYVALIRGLPALKDEADKLFADARKPRLVPFLAAIDNQKLVVAGLAAAETARRKQFVALNTRLQSALSEGVALARVLQPLIQNSAWGDQSIGALEQSLRNQPEKLASFHRALAVYADDVQQARIDVAVWGARADAAQFEESLVRSKFAAAQWDGLMDTLARVLVDYHGAGIKRAEIAEFFKALGLFSIGVGTAQ